jgi:sortase A
VIPVEPDTATRQQPPALPFSAPASNGSKPFAVAPRLTEAASAKVNTRRNVVATMLSAALMITACTLLGFSLWETRVSGWLAERSQAALREQFATASSGEALEKWGATVREVPIGTSSRDLEPAKPAAPVAPEIPQLPETGKLVGQLRIPAIDLDWMVVAGTDGVTLRKGPGAWLYGAYPGAPGNATLSAHRTTYGGPFRRLGDLQKGDQILFTSASGVESVFQVRGMGRVTPKDVYVTDAVPGVRLTLLTCDPPGSSARRLVIQAELISGPFINDALPESEWTFLNR